MPKHLLIPIVVCLFILSSCNHNYKNDPLAEALSTKKARADFKLFQNIMEAAHPALTEYITSERKNIIFDSVFKTIDHPITLRSLYNKLSFVADEVGCSHTFTALPSEIIDSLQTQPVLFPAPLILIEGELYANSDHEMAPGTKILSINNIRTNSILDSLTLYHTVEGLHRQTQNYLAASDFGIDYYTRFGAKGKFEVLVKDTSGDIQTIFLNPITLRDLNNRNNKLSYFDATDVPYSLTISNSGKYARLRVPSFEFESNNMQNSFEEFLRNTFELLSKKPEITNLVIDLRENTGGDLRNCFLFFSYLAKKPFYEYDAVVSHISKVPYEDYLTLAAFEKSKHLNRSLDTEFVKRNDAYYNLVPKSIDYWSPDKFSFDGKVYIITNAKVMSAASYFTLLCRHDGARVVGQETAGGEYSGNGFSMLEYTLPNSKIIFGFPFVQLKYTYAKPKTGQGIIPDYLVPDTYSSFCDNLDQQLNFITDSLLTKNQ